MFEIIGLVATGAVSVWGYVQSRRFMRDRLRFVDAAQKPVAPVIAGVAAAVVSAPIALLMPLAGFGAGTAMLFGAGVGIGVKHGQKDTRRLPGF